MRFLRCLLLILIAIDLPGLGPAFAAAPACAMQHGQSQASVMPAQHPQAGRYATNAHHCCSDSAAHGDAFHGDTLHGDRASGTSCQDGMQCQCGAMYQTAQPLHAVVVPVASALESTSPPRPIAAIATPHWRPPTTV